VLPWSQGKPHYQLNAQQTELHAIWPAKLVSRTPTERETARRQILPLGQNSAWVLPFQQLYARL